jgi:hypothetical protein
MRNARRPGAAVLIVAGGLAASPAAAAERPWVEVRSAHFVVVTDAGESQGRDLAFQFEQGRSVFNALWPWARQGTDREFVVLGTRDEDALRALAPAYFKAHGGTHPEGVYVSGADADYVALRLDVSRRSDVRVNPYKMAFSGYADNRIARQFQGRAPLWLREGLSELYGNTLILEKEVQVGRVIPWHLERLSGRIDDDTIAPSDGLDNRRQGRVATSALLPLPRLLTMRRDDPEIASDPARWHFAAQSWALVHYLMFGDGGKHRAKFNRLAGLLQSGASAEEATASALGDVSALTDGYRDYVTRPVYQFQKVPIDIEVGKEKWPARPLALAEGEVFRARFLAAMGDPAAARERIAAARQADPSFAGIAGAEAVVEGRVTRPVASATATAAAPAAAPAVSPAEQIRACNGGDEAACGRLATRLQAECDRDGAMCMPLAFLYANGRGVPRDPMQAEDLYARACEAGQARACEKQARMILEQSGAEGNVAQARALLQRACAAGEKTACGGIDRK